VSDVQELTRVERDASGPRTTYDDIEVGADLGTLVWSVEYSNVEGLAENDLDFHEWYVESSPWGPPVVTPMATYPPVRVLFTKKFNVRGVFYEYESEFHRPIHYGQKVIITGRVVDKWIKRDREYVKYEAEGRAEDGTLLFTTRRAHALDYLPRTVPRAGEGVDSGIAS
jgi:hypothetical protein